MKAESGWKLAARLAATSLVLCAVLGSVAGYLHLGTVLAVTFAAPLALLALRRGASGDVHHAGAPLSPLSGGPATEDQCRNHGQRPEPPSYTAIRFLQFPRDGTAPDPTRPRPQWLFGFAVVLFLLALGKFSVLGYLAAGFQPSLHDEWSYLFGAETLALGRLWNPPPPEAQFFDAFHILCEPRWVTRYPPGHPAALALGVLVGWPPAVVLVLTAGIVVWVYLLGRELGGERVGVVAGFLGVFAPCFDQLGSGYLSQSTLLFTITGCYVCALQAVRRGSAAWALAAGMLGGWAILTRPYSALALGFPLAVWCLWKLWLTAKPVPSAAPGLRAHGRLVFAAATPVAISLVLFAGYNAATTGSPWLTAWQAYNRQFEPDNTLGFWPRTGSPIPEGISARKARRAQAIAQERQQFTWRAAVHRALADPPRLSQMIFPAIGFYGLLPFAAFCCWGCRRHSEARISGQPWLLVGAIMVHHLAYSSFYSTWGAYALETAPFWIVLVAGGLVQFWVHSRSSDRPALGVAVPLALIASLVFHAREWPRFLERRRNETAYHRDFADTLARLPHSNAIVFVQLEPSGDQPYDLINNSPSLRDRVLVVLDRGEQNAALIERLPDRVPYLYQEATRTLIPL